MHYINFGTSSNDTTGEKGGGHHCTVRWTTRRGKPLSSPKGWGCEIIPMHKAIQSPCLYRGNSLVPSEGRATPPSPHPGDHHPRHRKNRGPSTGSISAEEENTMSLLISAYKRTLRPPPRTAAAAARGRLLTCKKVGNAPYSSVPQSTWVTSPRHPGGREASAAARRASLLSCRRQRLPHPGPARPAAPPADQTGEGPRGRAGNRGSGPAQPAHLPLPGPARSPGPPAPEPAGRPGPGPGFYGGDEAAAPRASGGGGGRNPGALGRAAPPSRARQDAWGLLRPAHPRGGGLTGPGRGPPPEAGRIRRGPRPGAGGGRVQAAGRAGRPAGGRRVAAAPGLK